MYWNNTAIIGNSKLILKLQVYYKLQILINKYYK